MLITYPVVLSSASRLQSLIDRYCSLGNWKIPLFIFLCSNITYLGAIYIKIDPLYRSIRYILFKYLNFLHFPILFYLAILFHSQFCLVFLLVLTRTWTFVLGQYHFFLVSSAKILKFLRNPLYLRTGTIGCSATVPPASVRIPSECPLAPSVAMIWVVKTWVQGLCTDLLAP